VDRRPEPTSRGERPRHRKRPPRPTPPASSPRPAHSDWQPPSADELAAAPSPGGGQDSHPHRTEILATPGDERATRRGGDAAPHDPAPPRDLAGVVTSAAVLGRPGEVEPVAAALALALRGQVRAKAATVAVAGAAPPAVEGASSAAAARRLGERLEAHGHEPRVRGRLAWVELDPDDEHFAALARRVTLVGAPAVLAVTAARTDQVDAALNEQDLLVLVTADPEGPLARLAVAGLVGVPILTVRPLGRGPARALARAGVRPARPVRHLLTTTPEMAR